MVMTKSKESKSQFVRGCIMDLNFEEFYKELSKSIHTILKPYRFRKKEKFLNIERWFYNIGRTTIGYEIFKYLIDIDRKQEI